MLISGCNDSPPDDRAEPDHHLSGTARRCLPDELPAADEVAECSAFAGRRRRGHEIKACRNRTAYSFAEGADGFMPSASASGEQTEILKRAG